MTKTELLKAVAKEAGYVALKSATPFKNSKRRRSSLHHPARVHDRHRAHHHRNGCSHI